MSKKTIIFGSLMLFFAVCIAAGFTTNAAVPKVPESVIYEDKVLMTQDQYAGFKQTIARDDVDIHHLEVYASDTPLVIFVVTVPAEMAPFYGEQTGVMSYDYLIPDSLLILIVVLCVGGVVGFVVTGLIWAFSSFYNSVFLSA